MADKFKSYKNESKSNFGRYLCSEQEINDDQIKIGCFQRIAAAAELMAKNHQQLIDERDRYKNYHTHNLKTIMILERRVAGLRGYIKRLKMARKE